jgi:hypothetical protein
LAQFERVKVPGYELNEISVGKAILLLANLINFRSCSIGRCLHLFCCGEIVRIWVWEDSSWLNFKISFVAYRQTTQTPLNHFRWTVNADSTYRDSQKTKITINIPFIVQWVSSNWYPSIITIRIAQYLEC